jgi:hypothetical protein
MHMTRLVAAKEGSKDLDNMGGGGGGGEKF